MFEDKGYYCQPNLYYPPIYVLNRIILHIQIHVILFTYSELYQV